MTRCGLRNEDLAYIIDVLLTHKEIDKALIFGSRAMGIFKPGSDVDIALVGNGINFSVIARIKDKLQEESPMPYLFDIVDFTHSESDNLKEHIRKFGIEFFSRK